MINSTTTTISSHSGPADKDSGRAKRSPPTASRASAAGQRGSHFVISVMMPHLATPLRRGAMCRHTMEEFRRCNMCTLGQSTKAVLVFVSLLLTCDASRANAQSCGSSGLAVQVLGSGGPETQDRRASTGYLIWE